ncbi:hypothetical protein ID850_06575 [Xenorhabdus sp. Flor]|uniref:hypothetical protein n=1 Tax=Xenorhabdus cabanillasii TaxID=351673 RepID=UPI0019C913E6|nr:hypothetical protein [Xenorhabdus sp. Flor]MBD2814433.1 hypothetical protein [Xenorhabdus sp. Flor]
MAKKTHIKTIENKTRYTVVIVNGEDGGKRIQINGFGEWRGDLVVPWIGRQDESWKALKIYIADEDNNDNVWVFQDYWYPPNQDAVKYHVGDNFSYENAKEIPGNNKGGGDKLLSILVGRIDINGQEKYSINLKMV